MTQAVPPASPTFPRREFCACMGLLTLSACGGGGGGAAAPGPVTTPPPNPVVTTNETKASLLAAPVGTGRPFLGVGDACPSGGGVNQGFFLVRDAGGIYAVSATCLHQGGRIAFNGGGFDCACHGSAYDLNGVVTRGPAPLGSTLPHLKVQEASAGGFLTVDTSTTVAASVRLT